MYFNHAVGVCCLLKRTWQFWGWGTAKECASCDLCSPLYPHFAYPHSYAYDLSGRHVPIHACKTLHCLHCIKMCCPHGWMVLQAQTYWTSLLPTKWIIEECQPSSDMLGKMSSRTIVKSGPLMTVCFINHMRSSTVDVTCKFGASNAMACLTPKLHSCQ